MVCQPLGKFGMLNCACFTQNAFHGILSINREMGRGAFLGTQKGGEQTYDELCPWW